MSTSRKSPVPRRRAKPADRYHHGDLRAALLAEGKRLLERHGPDGLSLREIARRLGVSHNAPYRHFPTREALLAALAADGFRTLAARTAEGARDGLQGAGLAYVTFALEEPAVFHLMFSSTLDKAAFPELRAAASASFAALRTRVAALYGEDNADMAAISAWSFVHGLANLLIAQQLPGSGPSLDIAARVLRAYAGRMPTRQS
jgi:AcrR family transcriptional regulator